MPYVVSRFKIEMIEGMTSVVTDRRKKVPDEVMWGLIGRGLSNSGIVRTLLSEFGVTYSAAGVTVWKKAHGLPVRSFSPERQELIPWRVLKKHHSSPIYRALHAHARMQAGLRADPNFELPLTERQRRDKLAVHLADHDAVVHYDQVNGWAIVPRRDGIDGDWIRDPRKADDGSPIEDPRLWQ